MLFETTPDTAATERVPTWPTRSMRSRMDRLKRVLRQRFDHATSATREASGDKRITWREHSVRRWRLRSEAAADREEHIENVMPKNTALAESEIQGSFASVRDDSPALCATNS